MQALQDLVCSECQSEFKTASALLQHFALHASKKPVTHKKLPDLYPINLKKNNADSDMESDSGIEDVNPLKFCLVTMEDNSENQERVRKYQCNYCSKKFGWPTDLKRHVLIHTGERPFNCQICGSTFTRNFLLKKHQRRCHSEDESEIPDLKPIGGKSRKQEKSKIKRVVGDQDDCRNYK